MRTVGSTCPKRSITPTGPKSGDAVLTTAPMLSAPRANTAASMVLGVQAATRSPDATPAARRAPATAAASARTCSTVSSRRWPSSSIPTSAVDVGSPASRVSTTFRRACGKKLVPRKPSPSTITSPGSPTMPRSSQASRQNCAGCATVHACSSGKPAAPCRATRSAITEPVPVSVTTRANHAHLPFLPESGTNRRSGRPRGRSSPSSPCGQPVARRRRTQQPRAMPKYLDAQLQPDPGRCPFASRGPRPGVPTQRSG